MEEVRLARASVELAGTPEAQQLAVYHAQRLGTPSVFPTTAFLVNILHDEARILGLWKREDDDTAVTVQELQEQEQRRAAAAVQERQRLCERQQAESLAAAAKAAQEGPAAASMERRAEGLDDFFSLLAMMCDDVRRGDETSQRPSATSPALGGEPAGAGTP